MSVTATDVAGVPVEIVVVLLATILSSSGFVIKRLFFSSDPVVREPTGEPLSRPELSSAAHSYVDVVSTPQLSSAARQRAAERLLKAATGADDEAPRAAKVARVLAQETDPGGAAALLREMGQALDSKRRNRRRLPGRDN